MRSATVPVLLGRRSAVPGVRESAPTFEGEIVELLRGPTCARSRASWSSATDDSSSPSPGKCAPPHGRPPTVRGIGVNHGHRPADLTVATPDEPASFIKADDSAPAQCARRTLGSVGGSVPCGDALTLSRDRVAAGRDGGVVVSVGSSGPASKEVRRSLGSCREPSEVPSNRSAHRGCARPSPGEGPRVGECPTGRLGPPLRG